MTRNSPICSRSRLILTTASCAPARRCCSMRASSAPLPGANSSDPSTATASLASSNTPRGLPAMAARCRSSADVLREADQLAVDTKREVIGAAEVETAIAAKFRRGDRIYRRLLDEIAKKSTRVETEGAALG